MAEAHSFKIFAVFIYRGQGLDKTHRSGEEHAICTKLR